ncbi:MAG: peptide deformylase [Puniceicoccales bacterium]|jgi:peptide deformylase|nr:peptide deformylase [Puniceicoccales bacterium]
MNFAIKQSQGTVLEIHIVGDRILRENTKIVTNFDKNLGNFIGDMLATMYAAEGIGLAAPQVGKSLKVVVIDVSPCLSEGDKCDFDGNKVEEIGSIMPLCLINPVIKKYSSEVISQNEGCLSVPDFSGHVKRPVGIVLTFVDQQNVSHVLSCNGMLARCLQHEVDHLNGKLYTDLLVQKDKKRFTKYLGERSKTHLSKSNHGNIGAAQDFQG